MAIASEASVVYQALTMSISDSFHVGVPVLAAEMFLCLAHNHLTHQNLTNSILILALVTVCKTWERVASCHGCEQLLSAAMRYVIYVCVYDVWHGQTDRRLMHGQTDRLMNRGTD